MQPTPLLALLLLTAAPHAVAQSTPTDPLPSQAQSQATTPADPALASAPQTDGAFNADQSGNRVNVSVAPYAWLTSFNGEVTLRGIEVDTTVSFKDVLEQSDSVFGLMGAVDVECNRFVFQINGTASTAEVSGSRGIFANGELDATLDFDTAWIELFGGYRLVDMPLNPDADSRRRLTLDAFVGGRFTQIEADATLTATTTVTLPDGEELTLGQSRERSQSESWAEPFTGLRLGMDLSEHWRLSLRADVGGFGVSGSDFSWQTAALVGYQWHFEKWKLGLFGGYRALGQDYSDGDFGWDVVTHGPLVGLQAAFAF